MYVYTVYDVVSQEHFPIFEAKNDEVAQRDFKKMFSRDLNPEDYRLFRHSAVRRDDGLIKCELFPTQVDITPDITEVR
jgi:hypothetical protein